MEGETTRRAQGDVAVSEVPPMRDIAFSMLSLLAETAASRLRLDEPKRTSSVRTAAANSECMREARAAIDAANALLTAVREIMELDALRAMEGMLTQLQIEYVRRASPLQ